MPKPTSETILDKTLQDIKSLKIQGAENVAKEAVKSLFSVLELNKQKQPSSIINALKNSKDKLVKTRPTEPCMRNALDFIFLDIEANKENSKDLVEHIKKRLYRRLRSAQLSCAIVQLKHSLKRDFLFVLVLFVVYNYLERHDCCFAFVFI